MAAQSAMIQHQINYTRGNEFEADRIGIGTMASAGYDPLGMASFFDYMGRTSVPTRPHQRSAIPDRSPDLFGPRGRSARPRRSNRPYPSRRFAELPVDPRTAALGGRRSAGRAPTTTPTAEKWRRQKLQERYGKDVAEIYVKIRLPPFPICRNWCTNIRRYAILRRARAGIPGGQSAQGIQAF